MSRINDGTKKQRAKRALRAIVSAPITLMMSAHRSDDYSPIAPSYGKGPFFGMRPFYGVKIDADGINLKKASMYATEFENEMAQINVERERRHRRLILLCVFAIIVPAIVAGLLLTQAYNCAFEHTDGFSTGCAGSAASASCSVTQQYVPDALFDGIE